MTSHWWQSLKYQLIAGGIATLVVLLSLVSFNTNRILDALASEALDASVRQTAEILNIAMVHYAASEDLDKLGPYLQELVSGNEYGIVYIALLDSANKVLLKTPQAPDNWRAMGGTIAEQAENDVVHVRQSILLSGNEVGALRFGFATSLIKQANLRVFKENLYLLGIVALVMVVLLTFITVRLSNRVRRLMRATTELAQGAEHIRAPEDGHDELAQLAKSFNRMADAIADRTRALLDSSRDLEQAQSVAHIGNWRHDLQTDLYTASGEARRIMGLSAQEGAISAQTFLVLIHPDDLADVRVAQQQAYAGDPHNVTFRILSEGEEKTIFARVVSEKDASGKVIATSGTLQDISERLRIERELTNYRQHLEQLVDERTRELAQTNERLREAVTHERKAVQAREAFLANMSHEIRTPMNAIIGMSHLALESNLDDKQRNYINKVHLSAKNLLVILNDILDFSKIESGKLELEIIDFKLSQITRNLTSVIGLQADSKQIQFSIEVEDNVPEALVGDPTRLNQILVNLCNNAIKFTQERGKVCVGIEVRESQEDGAALLFRISDNGIGMSREQQQSLFQPFSQADTSTTRLYGGTGLGLAISRDLVDLLGGSIWVESELGEGSDFYFTMPLKSASSYTRFVVSDEERVAAGQVSGQQNLVGVRVLIVEDNEINLELARDLLTDQGVIVETAENGQEALDKLREDRAFDAVLMDCQMPVMDGSIATRKIRSLEELRDLPVIAMTANAMASDQARILEAGMNDCLTKPINPDDLFSTLARWVRSTRRGGASAGLQPVSQSNLFPELPGVDVAAGLQVARNNEDLYRKLLTRFAESYRDFARDFSAAEEDRDPDAQQRLAHSLKGVAGNLGMPDLQQLALALEMACRNQQADDDCGVRLQAVTRELERVLSGLDRLLTT